MMFLLQSADGSTNSTTSGEQLGNLTLPQFRSAMAAAKVITPRFPPEKVDEIFTSVATAESTLARKVRCGRTMRGRGGGGLWCKRDMRIYMCAEMGSAGPRGKPTLVELTLRCRIGAQT